MVASNDEGGGSGNDNGDGDGGGGNGSDGDSKEYHCQMWKMCFLN